MDIQTSNTSSLCRPIHCTCTFGHPTQVHCADLYTVHVHSDIQYNKCTVQTCTLYMYIRASNIISALYRPVQYTVHVHSDIQYNKCTIQTCTLYMYIMWWLKYKNRQYVMIENIVHCVWLPRPKPLISIDLFQLSSACKLNRRRKSNLWDVTGTTFRPRSRSFSSFDFTHKYKENSPVTFNIHLLLVHLALLISS